MLDRPALLAALQRLAAETEADQLPELIGGLHAIEAQMWARLVGNAAPTPQPQAALVDASELAHRLNLPETWVRDAARRGRIPVVHAGVHVRFEPAAVIEAMRSGAAALPDRTTLSKRGRRAVDHRIGQPVRAKNASKDGGFSGTATTLLPRQPVEERKTT